jgi:phosphotransferase system enzyme I (PtsI)
LGVAPGIAIGAAHVREMGAVEVPEYAVAEDKVEAEIKRLTDAVQRSQQQLKKLKAKADALRGTAADELGFLLDAHFQMLTGSRLVRGAEARIRRERVNAEAAMQHEMRAIAKTFAQMEDAYLAGRADDIGEVGSRVVRNLMRRPYQAFSALAEGGILLAEELTPADTALLDPARIAGFATVLGGREGHTAIMARSLGLPAVLGVSGLLASAEGAMVIVDGGAGKVILDPAPATLALYQERQRALALEERQLARLARLPAETKDEVAITLQANVELPRELAAALAMGAQGIGLLRTEFMFMNREDLPDEEEQYQALKTFVVGMDGKPVTMRTLDVGGDKLAYSLAGHTAPSANPALGLRAIRFSLKHRELLEAQLSAMLRASAHGPVRILLPMISTLSEVRTVRTLMLKLHARLKRQGTKVAKEPPPLGVMIEIPGAALAADALATESDFFAIGTNDLTMYTLAIDRSDEQVAYLYNSLHPAVLRLIQFATGAALRARIPLSLCGEMAGDVRYTALLLGLGIRDLSMATGAIPRIKRRVRALDLGSAVRRAELVMSQWDQGRIATLLDDFDDLA